MDIHRCRFVPYPTPAINAVAFSRPHLDPAAKKSSTAPVRLAIGRANGDIEIWNPAKGSWHQETTIRGGEDRSVDGLVWTNEADHELPDGKLIHGRSRLFSIGYSSTVTEWDLENSRASKHANGQHGEIWCLAAQPMATSGADASSQRLIGGTIDGCLVFYSTDDDDLRFQRLYRTHKKNVKMVSIAFQSRHIAVVGCSDSAIRVFNMKNGSVLRQMTLGRDLAGGAKDIIAWSVKCLSSGDIVSGDSTGQICIWDGKTFTQAQRIQGHTQDVLSLATSADGTTIVSGGMDRRTALYQRIPGRGSRWAKTWHRRYHRHDVKTMASFESKKMSVVVTGGPDATPIVIPLRKSGTENHRSLYHLPQSVPVVSAPSARLIVGWWDREMHIWKLQRPINEMLEAVEAEPEMQKNRKLLGRILVKGQSNITAAAVSQDGGFIVAATASELKAFQLRSQQSTDQAPLRITRIAIPPLVASQGATNLAISPDGLWVCLTQGGDRVVLVKVVHDGPSGDLKLEATRKHLVLDRVKRDIPKHARLGGLGSYTRHITHVAFSSDSKMLAVADLAGYIDTWVLRGPDGAMLKSANPDEDEEADDAVSSSSSSSDDGSDDEGDSHETDYRWIRNPKAKLTPKLPAAPAVLSFSPVIPGLHREEGGYVQDYVLLAITTSSELFAFHPLQGKLTPWARRFALSRLPPEYRNVKDLAKGVIWQGSRAWIYGPMFLFMFDTSMSPEDGEGATALAPTGEQRGGIKRKRGADTGAGSKMELGSLAPKHVRMAVGGGGNGEWVDVEMEDAEDGQDDSDEGDGSDYDDVQPQADWHGAVAKVDGEESRPRSWWHTFKFRDILGIVPLDPPREANEAYQDGLRTHPPLEVAIVERPTWDVDLPERYDGDGGWAR